MQTITTAAETTLCANCGAALHGRFCASCGQEDRPLDPTLRELLGEAVNEIWSVDGRIARSLRQLFLAPGFLTREHLAGRRAAWVSPVRLYLTLSVAYFAIASLTGTTPLSLNIRLTGDDADAADAIERLGFASAAEMHEAVNRAIETWIPRAMFLLVPFFAWLVSRVWRRAGRNYPQHLIFSLHLFAAVFGAQALAVGLGYLSGHSLLTRTLTTVGQLYALGYAVAAMRAVYGGTLPRAFLRMLLVGIFYWIATIVVAVAIIVPVFWG